MSTKRLAMLIALGVYTSVTILLTFLIFKAPIKAPQTRAFDPCFQSVQEESNFGFDSYIIGGPLTSLYPVEKLDEYTGDKFYNLSGFDADMQKTREIAEYIINNYYVKDLIIIISMADAEDADVKLPEESADRSGYKATSKSSGAYGKFAPSNPILTAQVPKVLGKDTYCPCRFDVYNIKTEAPGEVADRVEACKSMEQHLKNNPAFKNAGKTKRSLSRIDECVENMSIIKELCDKREINLGFILSPVYYPEYLAYVPNEVARFQREMAKVTAFWDFSLSEISLDCRYFYDPLKFREKVGAMVLAGIFGDENMSIPGNFGTFVTEENINEHVKTLFKKPSKADIP